MKRKVKITIPNSGTREVYVELGETLHRLCERLHNKAWRLRDVTHWVCNGKALDEPPEVWLIDDSDVYEGSIGEVPAPNLNAGTVRVLLTGKGPRHVRFLAGETLRSLIFRVDSPDLPMTSVDKWYSHGAPVEDPISHKLKDGAIFAGSPRISGAPRPDWLKRKPQSRPKKKPPNPYVTVKINREAGHIFALRLGETLAEFFRRVEDPRPISSVKEWYVDGIRVYHPDTFKLFHRSTVSVKL